MRRYKSYILIRYILGHYTDGGNEGRWGGGCGNLFPSLILTLIRNWQKKATQKHDLLCRPYFMNLVALYISITDRLRL